MIQWRVGRRAVLALGIVAACTPAHAQGTVTFSSWGGAFQNA